jgi:hypothetical protein
MSQNNDDDFFLTPKQMHELTGFSQAAKQIEVLIANGIPYTLTGQEKPRVCRLYFEGRTSKAGIKPEKKPWSPKLALAS